MADDQKIVYSVDQGIARVTFNRPDKRNALDDEGVSGLRAALGESAADERVRVVLIGARDGISVREQTLRAQTNKRCERDGVDGQRAKHGRMLYCDASSSSANHRSGARRSAN